MNDNISPVHVILVNWNNCEDTLDCLESCLKLSYPNKKLLIVDNGSTDGSDKIIRERFPELTFIQTGQNLGFSGGNNIGIKAALTSGAEYIWLLNNDTIVAPDALDVLVSGLENDPAAGMAASLIYFHGSDRIWSAGGGWRPGILKPWQRGAYSSARNRFRNNEYVSSVSACSLLVRSDIIRNIGMLDEAYFLYWEDTDWCARALAAGKKILFVPQSRVWHKVSASASGHSKLQYYYYTRNGLLFCRRHDPVCMPLFMIYTMMDVLVGLAHGRTQMASGAFEGVLDFLRNRFGRRDFP